jgi:hypothetical protein
MALPVALERIQSDATLHSRGALSGALGSGRNMGVTPQPSLPESRVWRPRYLLAATVRSMSF